METVNPSLAFSRGAGFALQIRTVRLRAIKREVRSLLPAKQRAEPDDGMFRFIDALMVPQRRCLRPPENSRSGGRLSLYASSIPQRICALPHTAVWAVTPETAAARERWQGAPIDALIVPQRR
jgi:hypothetical protein